MVIWTLNKFCWLCQKSKTQEHSNLILFIISSHNNTLHNSKETRSFFRWLSYLSMTCNMDAHPRNSYLYHSYDPFPITIRIGFTIPDSIKLRDYLPIWNKHFYLKTWKANEDILQYVFPNLDFEPKLDLEKPIILILEQSLM